MSEQPTNTARAGKTRRGHKAAGARVLASGLGASAVLGIVGAFGAHATSSGGSTKSATATRRATPRAATATHKSAATTPTTIVWRIVHRTVVVVDPPLQTVSSYRGSGGSSYVSRSSGSYAAPVQAAPAAGPAPAPPPAPVAGPAPAPSPPPPAPAPAPPACSGSKCP
jgi:DNA polymerase-3 subunit gamma/tau